MTAEEIRLRRLTNQYLVDPGEKETVVRDLCGIQSQFFSHALHAMKIRCSDFDAEQAGQGMVKNWTLRGTVHVFPESDLPLFLRCGENYRRNEWTEKSFWNQRSDWALTAQRQAFLSGLILSALKEKNCTREELKQLCREQGMTEAEEESMFHPWGGGIRELCERGFCHYAVQEEKVFCLSPAFEPVLREEAELELARRYFTNYGPATIHDAMYFFRASAAQVKQWLSKLPVTSCEWGGRTYYLIENGKNYHRDIPACLFLAGFDQLMLGYEKKESLFLKSEYLRSIFNLAGIVMPPLLLNGDVAGRWKKKGGTLTIQPFRVLSPAETAAVKENAEILWADIRKIQIKE